MASTCRSSEATNPSQRGPQAVKERDHRLLLQRLHHPEAQQVQAEADAAEADSGDAHHA
jgi:hypothetical protein